MDLLITGLDVCHLIFLNYVIIQHKTSVTQV